MFMTKLSSLLAIVFSLLLSVGVQAAPSASDTARQIDAALAEDLFAPETDLAPRCSDEVFLRRIWLDVAGDIPTPEETIGFLLDPTADKRQRLITSLLDRQEYGQNWARYWRDVVFYRAVDERSQLASAAMEAELTRLLNRGAAWDDVAARFVTAQGDVLQNGDTAIVMAQDARTEETVAEISRIFLGIQIQCAQCHDHPYDRWTREQFHELAAFFPRVGVRQVRELTKRSFMVFANDKPSKRRPKDNSNRPHAEHFMPNLEDPSAKGTQVQPRFFLTGAELPIGTRDAKRRRLLGEWITTNDWFSIALVNRMWAELVGEPFYESVEDIGPDRTASAPQALDVLAAGFRDSDYDLKWLVRTICLTDAYQREARPRHGPGEVPFTANVPQRLRSDQLLNSIFTAIDRMETDAIGKDGFGTNRGFKIRREFGSVFGYDPSIAREQVGNSIPQILALMNSGRLDSYVRAGKDRPLKRLLDAKVDDEQLVGELYLRWLCRQPTQEELEDFLAFRKASGKRTKAFEDLQWVLLNSAEFQHRP